MRTAATEQRALPILITVGTLLGVGLAVASPAQRQPARPEVRPSTIATASPAAAPERSPRSRAGTAAADTKGSEQAVGGCHRLLVGGLPDDLGSGLPHAAHMLLANCAKSGARALAGALGHDADKAANHAQGGASHRGRSDEHRDPGRGGRGGNGSRAHPAVSDGKPDDVGPPGRTD